MKLTFKLNGKPNVVEFQTLPNRTGGITCLPKTSKDLDILQNIISDSNQPMIIQTGILNHLESKLKLPIDIDFDYNGAGYGFKIDIYSLLKKL